MSFDMPAKWPLVTNIDTRQVGGGNPASPLPDSRLENAFVEKDVVTGDWNIYKRPGTRTTILSPPSAVGVGRGMYYWNEGTPGIYSIFGGNIHLGGGPSIGAVNANNVYRFQEVLSSPRRLVFGNGVAAYFTDAGIVTQIVDVDFPASFVPGWAYLDGTLYVMDTACGIRGSNINDPVNWSPTNLIVAQNYPGQARALAKQLTYVVALKSASTEFFYNAGNATGSPLGRVDGALIPYGCKEGLTVAEIDGNLFWLVTNRQNQTQVGRLENLNFSIISTPPVERFLQQSLSEARGFGLKVAGHRFYCLTFSTASEFPALVYDIDQQFWYFWLNWFYVDSTNNFSNDEIYVQDRSSAARFLTTNVTAGYYTDAENVPQQGLIPVSIYTPNFDANTDRKKTLNLLRIDADQVSGSVLQIRVNDNDYKQDKWTNFRSIDLSKKRPSLARMGTFYRRAMHFRHACATPYRIRAAYLNMDIGVI